LDDFSIWAVRGSPYFQESPWGRRLRSLDDVDKDGVEVNLSGHFGKELAFNLGYTYQDFDYDGPYLAAAQKLSDRADHRVNAGLRYRILKDTLCMLDYSYQSRQVEHVQREDPWGSGNIVSYKNRMDGHQIFDFAIEHTLFQNRSLLKKLKIKFYINNLLDEDYEEARGYPMTDRTFGCALSCSL